MGVFTSPTQLRIHQRARFARVIGDMKKVHQMTARGGRKDFRESTQGGVKTDTLRKMGHPFGRIRSGNVATGGRGISGDGRRFVGSGIKGQVTRKGVLRPLPINQQTGKLHAAIRLAGPSGIHMEYRLFSSVPYAGFVLAPEGTRYMVARGLLGPRGLLRKRHRARMAALVDVVRKSQSSP